MERISWPLTYKNVLRVENFDVLQVGIHRRCNSFTIWLQLIWLKKTWYKEWKANRCRSTSKFSGHFCRSVARKSSPFWVVAVPISEEQEDGKNKGRKCRSEGEGHMDMAIQKRFRLIPKTLVHKPCNNRGNPNNRRWRTGGLLQHRNFWPTEGLGPPHFYLSDIKTFPIWNVEKLLGRSGVRCALSLKFIGKWGKDGVGVGERCKIARQNDAFRATANDIPSIFTNFFQQKCYFSQETNKHKEAPTGKEQIATQLEWQQLVCIRCLRQMSREEE